MFLRGFSRGATDIPAARMIWRPSTRIQTVVVLLALLLTSCGNDGPHTRSSSYGYAETTGTCTPTPKGVSGFFKTARGIEILVRAPANFRPEVKHPLLVVFAGAGMPPAASERLTGLTPEVTAAGFLVAYPQHLRPSRGALKRLAEGVNEVVARYCVDAQRIVLTGHSDGGSTATALAVMPAPPFKVAALAPSAAGFTAADLLMFDCPEPTPVMVFHGAKDSLFPGWGEQAAGWWARCNRCNMSKVEAASDTCLNYRGCAAPTYYCEGPQGHTRWPEAANQNILRFLSELNVPHAATP